MEQIPVIFFAVVLACAASKYFFQKPRVISHKLLVISSVAFRVLYAFALTVGQYYVWANDLLGKSFLNFSLPAALPISATQHLPWLFANRFGYFLFYSYGRFWLNVVVAVAVSYVFYLFLQALRKYRERFFKEGEMELGFLCALAVGWPYFVIFVPLVFVLVVIVSIFRRFLFKEFYTTLGPPFILAVFTTLIFGERIINILNLNVLKI